MVCVCVVRVQDDGHGNIDMDDDDTSATSNGAVSRSRRPGYVTNCELITADPSHISTILDLLDEEVRSPVSSLSASRDMCMSLI
jgi:hypothetical protein